MAESAENLESREKSSTLSLSTLVEFRDAEGGLSPDSEEFKERERLSREAFLKRQREKDSTTESEE